MCLRFSLSVREGYFGDESLELLQIEVITYRKLMSKSGIDSNMIKYTYVL